MAELNRLNLGHYVVGMEGVALLRSWIRAADGRASDRIAELVRFLAGASDGPLAIELAVPEKNVVDGYGEWAATYDGFPNPLIEIEQPVVRGLLDRLPLGSVLDAACGTGRHTAYLQSLGHRTTGVDASVAMLEKARAKASQVDFRVGQLAALPLDDASVDAAVCTLALTHVPDLGPVLAELARVVRRGGRVILSDQHPMMEFLGGSAFYVGGDGGFGYVTTYYHPHSEYFAAFASAGLSVVQCLEPRFDDAHIAIMLAGAGLAGIADEAFTTAMSGMPGALVWELERSR